MNNLQESIIEGIMKDPNLIEKINRPFEENMKNGETYLVYKNKLWYFGKIYYNKYTQKYDMSPIWTSYPQILDDADAVYKINLP